MNPTQKYSKLDTVIFYSTMLSFKIFGLAPFVVNILPNSQSKHKDYSISIIQSTKGSIYNLLLIIIVLFLFTYFDPYLKKDQNSKTTEIQNLYENVLAIIVNGVCVMTLLMYSIKQQTLVRLSRRLLNMEIELKKNLWNYKNLKTGRCYQAMIFVIYVLINIEICVAESFEEYIGMVYIMILEFPEIIIEGILIQFSLALISLKTKFYNLNEALILMEDNNKEHNSQSPKVFCIKVSSSNYMETDFYFIKKSHRTLYELSNQFLEFYSWMMMLSITILCIELIDDSYYFIEFIIYKKTPLTTIEIIRLLGWIIKNIFPITVLTSSVTSISTEMARTSKIISKLMSISETHPQVKYEMEQFLIELLHRNLEFTACGLFSIDGSLLTSIISTTITYLIIFLQFKRSNRGISINNQTNIYSIEDTFNTTELYAFNVLINVYEGRQRAMNTFLSTTTIFEPLEAMKRRLLNNLRASLKCSTDSKCHSIINNQGYYGNIDIPLLYKHL